MSGIGISDNTGNIGNGLKIDKDNRAHTRAVNIPHQHAVSSKEHRAFQISTTQAIATTTQNILFLKNTSDTRDLVITNIRLSTAGAAVTNTSAFFTVRIGGDRASGGTTSTPTNMYVGNQTTTEGDFFDSTSTNIVLSGTQTEIDRSFEANVEISYNKIGSLILPKNSVLIISHIGSTVAGDAHARVSFFYEEPEV